MSEGHRPRSAAAAWLDGPTDPQPETWALVELPPPPPDLAEVRERSLPWLESRDSNGVAYEHCKLCKSYATDEHLLSKGHLRKLAVQSDYERQREASGPPAQWGDPKYFEWKDSWGWFCKLCRQWADDGHTEGKKHRQRLEYDMLYGGNYMSWYGDEGDNTYDGWANSKLLVPDERDDEVSLDPWGLNHSKWADANVDPWADMCGESTSSRNTRHDAQGLSPSTRHGPAAVGASSSPAAFCPPARHAPASTSSSSGTNPPSSPAVHRQVTASSSSTSRDRIQANNWAGPQSMQAAAQEHRLAAGRPAEVSAQQERLLRLRSEAGRAVQDPRRAAEENRSKLSGTMVRSYMPTTIGDKSWTNAPVAYSTASTCADPAVYQDEEVDWC